MLGFGPLSSAPISGLEITQTGILAAIESKYSMNASGKETINGAFAAMQAKDVMAASGKQTMRGAFAATARNDTMVASGKFPAIGRFAAIQMPDIMNASGLYILHPPVNRVLSGGRGPRQFLHTGGNRNFKS